MFSRLAGVNIRQAFVEYEQTDQFRNHPLEVRIRFHRVADWLSRREAMWPLVDVTASFTRMLRDRAARERGWRHGNFALVLLQTLIARAVDSGTLVKDRTRIVPKLLPPRGNVCNDRRRIKPIRHRISASGDSILKENSNS